MPFVKLWSSQLYFGMGLTLFWHGAAYFNVQYVGETAAKRYDNMANVINEILECVW